MKMVLPENSSHEDDNDEGEQETNLNKSDTDVDSQAVELEDENQTHRLDIDSAKNNPDGPLALSGKRNKTSVAKTYPQSTPKQKLSRNELTKLIPGYIAPLNLDSSVLDPYRVGISELRKRAERTDRSTAAFVVGATSDHAQAMWSSPATTVAGFVPSTLATTYSSFKSGTKRPLDQTAGSRWFNMAPTPMTDELKTDLAVIRNRNYLDPKRFYKSSDPIKGKVLQVGTVIEGPTEFLSARLSKKQRRANLAEEIMADPASADYTRNKFKAIQQAKAAKAPKWKKKGKKGKRGF